MVTKGIVEEIIDNYQAKVRLPVYNGIEGTKQSTPSNELSIATICTLSNISRPVEVDDIVYVSFEDNDLGKPVILGQLYKKEQSNNLADINSATSNINKLKVSTSASLPNDTTIGNIKPAEIAALDGIQNNIQDTLNNLNITIQGDYLSLKGGTMKGTLNLANKNGNLGDNGIRWDANSLPQDTNPNFICTIDAFSDGGRQKWASMDSLKSKLGLPNDYILKSTGEREFGMLVPKGTRINANVNLNSIDYLKVGNYYCSADVTAATLTNCPTNRAFMMQVLSPLSTSYDNETTSGWVYRLRILTTYKGKVYYQASNSSATAGVFSYGDWQEVAISDYVTLSTSQTISADKIFTGTVSTMRLNTYGGQHIINDTDNSKLWKITTDTTGALIFTYMGG